MPAGCRNVSTYIQSGNVIFESPARGGAALLRRVRRKLYVTFLFRKPRGRPLFPLVSAKEALEAVAVRDREVFIVSRRKKNGFFGFPNGIIEKELGVLATRRNWTTVTKIAAFARGNGDG